MSTQPKLKYPYRWGRDAVQDFVERYARGTYFLGLLLDISPGEVRHYLILVLCHGRSVQFESVKRVIKTLETYRKEDLTRYSPEDRKRLYKCLLYLAQDDEIDYKTWRDGLDDAQNLRLC